MEIVSCDLDEFIYLFCWVFDDYLVFSTYGIILFMNYIHEEETGKLKGERYIHNLMWRF